MSNSHTPTEEQDAALELFRTGKSIAVEAGAGTGKTSTLCLLAEGTTRRGQYVAFNKAIVTDATGRMPENVGCRTAHSLAFGAIGRNYKHRLDSNRMRSSDIALRLHISPCSVKVEGAERILGAGYLAGLVMQAIGRFSQSEDDKPGPQHLPYVEGIDIPRSDGKRGWANNNALRDELSGAIATAWRDLVSMDGALPFKHDHYLKLWHLSQPRINADFILFDEAQDANPVLRAIVAAQRNAQIVWTGDSQQQIYEFTGAVNAMASVPHDARTFLTRSFRFGPAIAAVANQLLEDLDADIRLIGTQSIPSVVGPIERPAAALFRTNAAAVRHALLEQGRSRVVHMIGGAADVVSFTKAAQRLMRGERVEHPELACFTSWNEVLDYVKQDPLGSELALNVNLIQEFQVEPILEALARCVPMARAEVVISTAHKAKGLEWDTVKLGADFNPKPRRDDAGKEIEQDLSPAELRLLYVACTRAKLGLDADAIRAVTARSRTASTPGLL